MKLPSKVVVLGECLEIEFTDGRIYKPRGSLLCCNPSGSILWVFPNSPGGWKRVSVSKDRAHELYEKWSDFEPDKEKKIKVSERGKLKRFGKVKSIVYRSDKWNQNGKKIDYIHTFNRNHYPILSTNNIKNPGFCRISGGKLAVKAVGITG